MHASVSSSTPAPHHTRLTAWVMVLTDQGLIIGTAARERHAGKWRTGTGLPGGCGLMAATSVLGMVRSSRRLTACDVVVGMSL